MGHQTSLLTDIAAEIDRELAGVTDERVIAHIQSKRISPALAQRGWDYGEPGQSFPCWTVLEHLKSGTGIAYCQDGFGPRNPWGLVWLGEVGDPRTGMGMDSGWYPTFMQAYFESFAASDLAIWRVMQGRPGAGSIETPETSWDEAWRLVEQMRAADPNGSYYVEHTTR